MAEKRDYYEVLGLNKSASKDEIKSAYRRLAKKYHPDLNHEPGAADKFKEVQEAYDILYDDQKRAQYDQFGHAAFEQGGSAGGGPFGGGFSGAGFGDVDLGDIFSSFFVRRNEEEEKPQEEQGLDMKIPVNNRLKYEQQHPQEVLTEAIDIKDNTQEFHILDEGGEEREGQ